MFKGTLAVLCGKVSGVGQLCGRERRDYSGDSFEWAQLMWSCSESQTAGRQAHAYSFICGGAPNGKEVKAIARMWG